MEYKTFFKGNDKKPPQEFVEKLAYFLANDVFTGIKIENIKHTINTSQMIIVALSDENIVGVSIAKTKEVNYQGQIIKLQYLSANGVSEKYRGQGIGKKIGLERIQLYQPDIFFTTTKNAAVAGYLSGLNEYIILNDPKNKNLLNQVNLITIKTFLENFLSQEAINSIGEDLVRKNYMSHDPSGTGVQEHPYFPPGIEPTDGVLIIGIRKGKENFLLHSG